MPKLAFPLPAVLLFGAVAGGAALPKNYLPAHQVRRGMRGYGLSVFQGTKPQRFEVEIIGVLRNAFPKQDIILARMRGPVVEKTGIIAGMSGSPAENMFGVVEAARSEAKAAALPPPGGSLDAPLRLAERVFSEIRVALTPPRWDSLPGPQPQLYRLRAPLAIAGLTPPAFDLARETFEGLGFMAVQGASGGSAEAPETLQPGSALAVVLAEGDIDMSASGTVTDLLGDTVLAFGHPMLGEGRLEMPIATAAVQYCYPSLIRSFKLTSAGKVVGTLTTDMQAAVVGKIGKVPRMIPVEARLKRGDLPGQEVYRCRAADHPRLTPLVIQSFLLNCLLVRGDFPRENTLRYAARTPSVMRQPWNSKAASRSAIATSTPASAAFVV